MSILQKILQDMFVEPELLNELDDEQKQILFCKMREEQIRRWAADEKQHEEQKLQNGGGANSVANNNQQKSDDQRVRWLLGQDGEPWVWVMGEHAGDKTIDQILEEETQDKARKLAEEEAEKLRLKEEEELKEKLRQEQFEAEQERNRLEKEEQETKRQLEETLKKLKDQTIANNVATLPIVRGGVVLRSSTEPTVKLLENDAQKVKEEFELKLRKEADKKIEEEKNRRTSEIYQTLKEARERANVEAEKEAEEEKRYWEEQEKKAREAEDQIRNIARKAREQHKMHGLRTSSSLQSLLNKDSTDSGAHSNNPQRKDAAKLSRPAKPKSRSAIIQWYMKEELPVGAGLIPGSSKVAPWFHGIIAREEAEELLRLRPVGSFLVRVSERIWGYTVSYKANAEGDAKVKHYLIERISEGYQFLGTNQLVHDSLYELISYHQTVPVTLKGQEVLREPVGQSRFPPDYQELLGFGKNSNSSSSANVL